MFHESIRKVEEEFSRDVTDILPQEEPSEVDTEGGVPYSSTLLSPDLLDEYSKQLKGQVVIYVRKRLNAMFADLKKMENELSATKKRSEYFEREMQEVSEKLAFAQTNFVRRDEDLAALKDMGQNHQICIVNIMQQLERKAEAYIVNQKVNRSELSAIEDRVIKLCKSASSEITGLEDKVEESFKKFLTELDRKLYTEELEVRTEPLLNKIRKLECSVKEILSIGPAVGFDNMRPIEIKKYVINKDGTRIKQSGKTATWGPTYTVENVIPLLSHHDLDDKVEKQVQKEVEKAHFRESRRYVQGTYTKVPVGRK